MKTIVTMVIIMSSWIGFAQNSACIYGTVYTKDSVEVAPFAKCWLVSGDSTLRKTKADLNGYYQFDQLPAGEYSIFMSYVGHDTLCVMGIELAADTSIDVSLELPEIVILIGCGFYSCCRRPANREREVGVIEY